MTVIDWLLDADPAIRWQAMRDLTHEPADVVAAERARVATEGWGAELLALQAPDGLWAGNAFSHSQVMLAFELEGRNRVVLVRVYAQRDHDDFGVECSHTRAGIFKSRAPLRPLRAMRERVIDIEALSLPAARLICVSKEIG